mgnify:FL=1
MTLPNVTVVTPQYSNPLLDHVIERMFTGGATLTEVYETMIYFFNILNLDTTDDHLKEHIAGIFAEISPEKENKKPISARVEDFVTTVTRGADLYSPVTFLLQDVISALNLTTHKEKTACRVALHRMKEKGIIDSPGGKYGCFRVVNSEDRSIDLSDTSDLKGEMRVGFPLNVHQFIKVMPHTVYIIAGETDSGKSAYLLNFSKMNSQMHKVHYHSSEMGKAEFLDRLQYFWPDASQNKNMKFYERSNDFASAIKRNPDDIHIIDYMQMFDNFYLMAEKIDAIGKSLNNGLAFIAIQKPKGRDEGVGGERTKDLSRLYLSLAPGKLKIVKAKNWKDPKRNPNGMEICFKLAEGCKFFNDGDWHKS